MRRRHALAAVLVCAAGWSADVPARRGGLKGDEPAVRQAVEQAMAEGHWHVAVRLLDEALAGSAVVDREELLATARRCRLQARIEERYQDGSIGRLIVSLEAEQARALRVEVCRRIEQAYYPALDEGAWLARVRETLAAAAECRWLGESLGLGGAGGAWRSGLQEAIAGLPEHPSRGGDRRAGEGDRPPGAMEETARELAAWEGVLSAAAAGGERGAGVPAGWAAVVLAYALADSLDEHSYLLSPRQYEQFRARLGGSYVGVGVDLTFGGPWPRVFDVLGESPAQRAGVAPGDWLLAAGAVSLHEQSEALVGTLLAGPRHSRLQVTIRRGERERTLEMERDLVLAPSVRQVRVLGGGASAGYLRIASFDRDTAVELVRAVRALRQQGVRALVIDLRCNGGGVLAAGVESAGLFVPDEAIVTVVGRTGRTTHVAGDLLDRFTLPVALLVDRHTASAAEIFAAALQEHGRAIVIGEPTRGKGTVQTVYPLETGATGLCVTTASYLPPSGRSFEGRGIEPDVRLRDTGPAAPAGAVPGTKSGPASLAAADLPGFSLDECLNGRDAGVALALEAVQARQQQ